MTCLWRIIKLEWRNERQTAGKVMIPNPNIPSPGAAHPSPARQPNLTAQGRLEQTAMVGPPVVYPASLRYLAKLLGSCCCTHSVLEQLSLLVSTWWLWAYRPVNIELRLGQHIGVVAKPFLNSAPEILEINKLSKWSNYWKYVSIFASKVCFIKIRSKLSSQ